MRTLHWTTLAALTLAGAAPAAAQVSARVHIDVPVGRAGTYEGYHGRLAVRDYDPVRFGAWTDYYDQWVPETVYLEDGSYYDYQVDAYATPVVVYSYRNEIFLPPRAPEFFTWRDRWHPEFSRAPYRGRPVYREGYRPAPVYDRNFREGYRPAPRYEGGYGYRPAPRPEPARPVAPARGAERGRTESHGQGGGEHQGGRPMNGGNGGHGPRSGSRH